MNTRKPTLPGVVLFEDVIKELNISITEAAKNLGVSRKTLTASLFYRSLKAKIHCFVF